MTAWTTTDDVAVFAEHALPLLCTDPVANTVALTVVDWLLSGRTYSDSRPFFAWYGDDSGETTGAVLMTPPHELVLAILPTGSVPSLVATLRAAGLDVPGARGAGDATAAFAEAWTAGTDLVATPTVRLRLYGMGNLTPRDPAPAGHAREATEADASLVSTWWQVYQREVETRTVDVEPLVSHSISNGLLWLWVDGEGVPVSMAGRKEPVGGASRIGPVFTPPEHRGHGFGSAVTAACASAAVSAGAEHVLLFTDLANPVSNLIYQRIGFQPISDAVNVAFTAPAETATVNG